MGRTTGGPARLARWVGVLLGAWLVACGPAPGDGAEKKGTIRPRPPSEALPLAPFGTTENAGVSHPFDVSRPSLMERPTGSPGVGVAFDGKQYLVVWADERDGGVFGARVKPNGQVLDPAGFPINLGTGLDAGAPRVAWDGKQFVVVWVSGSAGVFGAHVGSDGRVRRHFIFASSDEVGGPPGLACANQVCLVAYNFSGDEETLVGTARIESDGDVLDGETLSPAPGFALFPSVAWDGKQFLVVWQDERGGGAAGYDLFGARVKKDGTVLDPGGVRLLALPGAQRFPDVTWTGSRFLIVWEDDRFGTPDVFGVRLRRDLSVDGPTDFPISTGAGEQTAPRAAPSGSKSLVVWDDTRQGPHRARAARVGDDGRVWDPSGFTVSSGDFDEERLPGVAAGDHQFFVAFAGGSSGTSPFESQHILGTRVQHDTTVKDSPALLFTRSAYPQDSPAAAAGAGSSLVVWREVREGIPRLLATRVRPDGRVLDVPLTLPAGPEFSSPSVAWDGDVWLVVWAEGTVFSGIDLVGARVSGAGRLLDAVSLPLVTLPGDQFEPAVASNLDDFFVVWTDTRNGPSDVFGARVSSGGTVLDPGGFRISPLDPFTQQHPSVVATGGLRYFVAWLHLDFITLPGPTELSVRGARVDAEGTVLDTPEILINPGPAFVTSHALAWDGTNTLVVWSGLPVFSGGFGPDVFAARVDAEGEVLDTPAIPVATGDDRTRTNVTVTFDGTDFWLAWEQSGAPPFFPALDFPLDVYGARIRPDGTVRDPGGRAIAAHQPEPETQPVLVSSGGGRATVFYTEFVTDDDAMNLRVQGRVLTGLGSSALGVPAPAVAR